jgi:hypothetical protein
MGTVTTLRRKSGNGALIRHGAALCPSRCIGAVTVSALGYDCLIEIDFSSGFATGSYEQSYSAPYNLDQITWLPQYTDPGHSGSVSVSLSVELATLKVSLRVETCAVWPLTGAKYTAYCTFSGTGFGSIAYDSSGVYGGTGHPVAVSLGTVSATVASVTPVVE